MGGTGSKSIQTVRGVEVEAGNAEKGVGGVRRSSLYATSLQGSRYEDVNTLYELFLKGYSFSKDEPLFVS